jgi:ferredoxin-NADP reductase
MQGVHRRLLEWGVDGARVHYEFFGPKGDLATSA